jgi:hypothetical protein
MKTIAVINHHCNRMVYFAVDNDYTPKGKSIEQIYNDSYMASFDRSSVSKFAIRSNINNKED